MDIYDRCPGTQGVGAVCLNHAFKNVCEWDVGIGVIHIEQAIAVLPERLAAREGAEFQIKVGRTVSHDDVVSSKSEEHQLAVNDGRNIGGVCLKVGLHI